MVAQDGFPVSVLLQMPVRFILLCVLDVEGETRNLHAYTHLYVFFSSKQARAPNHQGQYFTALVVSKQRSRTEQDPRVSLNVYNPGLALEQIKLEESTGADLVDMTHEKNVVDHLLCGEQRVYLTYTLKSVSAVNVRANPLPLGQRVCLIHKITAALSPHSQLYDHT